jgi:hypothetical protein
MTAPKISDDHKSCCQSLWDDCPSSTKPRRERVFLVPFGAVPFAPSLNMLIAGTKHGSAPHPPVTRTITAIIAPRQYNAAAQRQGHAHKAT